MRRFRQTGADMEELPKTIESIPVFKGRVFGVRTDRVRFPDGAEHRLDIVEHPGSVVILAAPEPDRLVLVRQYRHPAGRYLWELPAGTAEPGEDPAAGAARELAEETGFRAGRLRHIGSLLMTPGFCDEIMHFFYAEELQAGPQSLDEDERIDYRIFTREAAWRLVAEGEIGDVKTVLALLWMVSGQGEIGAGFGR
jgi:ADP-ribose pyrophosphatase